MKNFNTLSRFACVLAIAFIALAMPGTVAAKWSKASSSFSYDGVSVKVTDRHREIGAMYDTYGYTTFENNNNETVTVNWKCFGVLTKGGKLVCVNDNSFTLAPREVRKEVYSYGAGKFTHRDFRTYVIAIEVIKGVVQPDIPLPANTVKTEEVTAANADEVYNRVMKHLNEKITQQDYTDGLNWLLYTLKNEVGPLWLQMEALRQHGKDTQIIWQENEELLNKWKTMTYHMTLAHGDGLFTPENEAKYEKLTDEIDSYR